MIGRRGRPPKGGWLRPASKMGVCWCGRTRFDGGPKWTRVFECSAKCAALPRSTTRAIMRRWRRDDGEFPGGLPGCDVSVVYAVRSAIGPVKFGTTTNLRLRFSALQTGSPCRLVLGGWFAGDASHESRIHAAFAAYRMHGEWFAHSPAVLRFVAKFSLERLEKLSPSPVAAACEVAR